MIPGSGRRLRTASCSPGARRRRSALPSNWTSAALVRPIVHSVSSAGSPVTVTTGVRALAVILTRPFPFADVAASGGPGRIGAGQLDPDRRLAQHEPGQPQPAPQHVAETRAELARFPVRLRPAHVLVVHEVLHQVEPLVGTGQPEDREARRAAPDQLDQLREGRPAGQARLHVPGVAGQRAARDAWRPRPACVPAAPGGRPGQPWPSPRREWAGQVRARPAGRRWRTARPARRSLRSSSGGDGRARY